MRELERQRATEVSLAWVRLAGVLFAALNVGLIPETYPQGYRLWSWVTTAAFAAGAVGLFAVAHRELDPRSLARVGLLALSFDTAVVYGYMLVYTFEPGVPSWGLLYLPVIEAALRYRVRGGIGITAATTPALALIEWWRDAHFSSRGYDLNFVVLPVGLALIIGFVVGRLVESLRSETQLAEDRAVEALGLRDELRRRADLLDAANRCARALGSSLELEHAFAAFIRELRELVDFDRVAIVLADGGAMRVMANAGLGVEEALLADSALPPSSLAEEVVRSGRTTYRADMRAEEYADEPELIGLGLRSRVAAPILAGARATGMLSLLRREVDSFDPDEVELVALLGRLVGNAVQNIRAYEAEHRTVEELRRLSALRADFVSLVSHELRSPMAAVIGSARTLQERWRELTSEQRGSFLALIADETSRLATLVADVLDTSRIDAGTFSYTFGQVDVGKLVEESCAAARAAQDEVEIEVDLRGPVPHVRGDRERLQQVLGNLLENAVKFSPADEPVEVVAYARAEWVRVEVRDRGPGIPGEHQQLIFEKFARVPVDGSSTPGSGLGLFIARSIAEAHGGSLAVSSGPDRGSTFTLELPCEPVSSVRAVG